MRRIGGVVSCGIQAVCATGVGFWDSAMKEEVWLSCEGLGIEWLLRRWHIVVDFSALYLSVLFEEWR
jgi:hypothetical protein